MQFALMNNAVLVRMEELDGILDREHMTKLLLINFVDNRSQGGRFAGTSRARHQYDSIAKRHNLLQFGRQVQRFEVRDFAGNYAHYDGARAALHEDINSKPVRA